MDLAAYSFEILTFLFVIAVIAGFIDTLVGGGGLLAVPALLLSGIPPSMYSGPINSKEVWEQVLLLFYYFERKS